MATSSEQWTERGSIFGSFMVGGLIATFGSIAMDAFDGGGIDGSTYAGVSLIITLLGGIAWGTSVGMSKHALRREMVDLFGEDAVAERERLQRKK